jgi:hypothetical protein
MTAIVHEVLLGAIASTEATPANAVEIITNAKAELHAKLEASSGRLFSAQIGAVEVLVKKLAQGAKVAAGRRDELQEEILHNLHEQNTELGHAEEAQNGVDDGASWQDLEGGAETDDHWAKTTEEWHNRTVAGFFEKFDEWLHPKEAAEGAEEAASGDNTTEHSAHGRARIHPPHPHYTNTSELYGALLRARDEVQGDVAKWRDAQKLIHERAAEIKAMGLPTYTDADEPSDDGYQGSPIFLKVITTARALFVPLVDH